MGHVIVAPGIGSRTNYGGGDGKDSSTAHLYSIRRNVRDGSWATVPDTHSANCMVLILEAGATLLCQYAEILACSRYS